MQHMEEPSMLMINLSSTVLKQIHVQQAVTASFNFLTKICPKVSISNLFTKTTLLMLHADSVLYGGAIDNCKLMGLDSYNSGEVFDMLINIEDENTNSTISSLPFCVCPYEMNYPDCSKSHISYIHCIQVKLLTLQLMLIGRGTEQLLQQ